ncbi:MAG: NADH-quinone oxidoreductase subunit H [Planctomycetota bacterium]|nr:MAG: NADH-quinone oxidoreductase subunit H [Planctomycetota bacterium]
MLLAAHNLSEFFRETCRFPGFWPEVLAAVVHAVLVAAFFGLPAGVFIWAERKIAGRIQDRLGPTRTGGRFGWLQSLADGIKLLQKEDLIPGDANAPLFRLAPYLVVVASFSAYMVLPFSDGWVAVASKVGVFLILALMSLEVLGVIIAGYSSGSKWALFGAMREAAQMVSYEIPMAICAVVPIVAAGTLDMVELGRMQTGGFWNWLIFHDPFTFLAFFCYFVCATASCKRAPFDLAEAESELVAGFLTEYSGMRWSFFFLAEYASMFAVGGIATYLFLGGWDIGLPIIEALGLKAPGASSASIYLANLIGMFVFLAKATTVVFVQIWVRWTLPRLRIDQVMTTCLKYLVPISCFLFLGAALWPLAMAAGGGRSHWGDPPAVRRLDSASAVQPVQTPLALDEQEGAGRRSP